MGLLERFALSLGMNPVSVCSRKLAKLVRGAWSWSLASCSELSEK